MDSINEETEGGMKRSLESDSAASDTEEMKMVNEAIAKNEAMANREAKDSDLFRSSADYWESKYNESTSLIEEAKRRSNGIGVDLSEKMLELAKLPYVSETPMMKDLEAAMASLAASRELSRKLRTEKELNKKNLTTDGALLTDGVSLINVDDYKHYVDKDFLEYWDGANANLRLAFVKCGIDKQVLEIETDKQVLEIDSKTDKQVSEIEKQVSAEMYTVSNYLNEVSKATRKVGIELMLLSGLSQAEGTNITGAGTSTRMALKADSDANKRMCVGIENSNVNNATEAPDASDLYKHILEKSASLEEFFPKMLGRDKDNADSEGMGKLKKAADAVDGYLRAAVFLPKPLKKDRGQTTAKPNPKSKLGKLVKATKSKIGNLGKSTGTGRMGTVASPLKEVKGSEYKAAVAVSLDKLKQDLGVLPTPKMKPSEMVAPGAYAYESECTQPFLTCVFRGIAGAIHPSSSEIMDADNKKVIGKSPTKTRQSTEVFSKDCRFQIVQHDNQPNIAGEIKSGCRENAGPLKLLQGGVDQILATMSKIVTVGFNFANAGVPSHATAFVANMASIQIFHLRLEHVGTPDVQLVLYKSKHYPLMSKDVFDRWVKSADDMEGKATSSGVAKEFEDLGRLLYDEPAALAAQANKIPPGFVALWCLLHRRHKELFGPNIESTADIVGDLIGTGSQGHVFRHKGQADKVVKISRYGAAGPILREAKILRALSRKSEPCENIPILETLFLPRRFGDNVDGITTRERLEVTVGGVKAILPAMVMQPYGVPSLLATSICTDKAALLGTVFRGITSALHFIHTHNIHHLDVNPSNIVVLMDENKKPTKAILIDFAIAYFPAQEPTNERGHPKKLTGFWGTPNYTHRAVFLKYPSQLWKPENIYDFASLGFSLSVMANNGVLPWASFVELARKLEKGECQDIFNVRYDKAKKALLDFGILPVNQDLLEGIKKLIECDLAN